MRAGIGTPYAAVGATRVMKPLILAAVAMSLVSGMSEGARSAAVGEAERAAVHPVGSASQMHDWLARVPLTWTFPPDFAETLRGHGPLITVEMSTAPGCLPCGDMWKSLHRLRTRYGLTIRTIDARQALERSGRLGLPWIGHPVLWVRPTADPNRTIPVAIGTDHEVNLARNIYLATKMLSGVRPGIGLRAMAKFTGIVAPTAIRLKSIRKD